MIESFGNDLAEDLFFDRFTKDTRRLSAELRRAARRKLLYLHEAEILDDMRVPPGNRLELLRGDRRGMYSVRINDQWRVVFRWLDGRATGVTVEDYHR
jgi:proteic killer suppression protein